jgi:hypothetical protein
MTKKMDLTKERQRRALTAMRMIFSIVGMSFVYVIQMMYSNSAMLYTPIEKQCDLSIKPIVDVNDDGTSTGSRAMNATVISWEGIADLEKLIREYFSGYLLCEIHKLRSTASDPNLPIVLNISFSCNQLYEESVFGTGNYIV